VVARLGGDGWELVARNNYSFGSGSSGAFEMWFKRPISD
jgi:hypothetical protein